MRAAEGVDALRVVADHQHVAVRLVLARIGSARLFTYSADHSGRGRLRLRRHRDAPRHRRRDQQALRRRRALGGGERAVPPRRAGHARDHPGHLCRGVLVLASGGLRQYIEAVLEANLTAELRAHVRILANEGVFGPGGLEVRFPTEDAARKLGCTACGSCKRVAVAEARKAGARHVIGAGDGFADRCLARSADSIWAREGSLLHRWCVENRVAHTPFSALHGLASAVAAFPG